MQRFRHGGLLIIAAAVLAGTAAVPESAPARPPSGSGHAVHGASAGELSVVRVAPGDAPRVRSLLEARGARVLVHLPDDRLLVAAPATASVAEGLAVEAWTPDRAITPALAGLNQRQAGRFAAGVPIVLGLAFAGDLDDAARDLAAAGAEVRWTDAQAATPQLGLTVAADRLEVVRRALTRIGGLVWADVQPPIRLLNDDAAWRCQSGIVGFTPLFDVGLDGAGQVVGIMDTGIDIDHCAFRDSLPTALNGSAGRAVEPRHRKVLAVDFYWQADWPSPGPFDWDDHGHGSHVAGSAAGDAGEAGRWDGFDGMAPAARLVIQDGGFAVDDCADLPGLGCPVRPLGPVLQQAYDQGARLHSNSWGDEENLLPHNRYTERAADVDRFVWQHPDMTVLFAAGNAGSDGEGSVISPATAKNVVAVGATRRADIDPPCPAPFTSLGPTHDGRIKPDVLAPGTEVVSAASDFVVGTDNCDWRSSSGTSMATPLVAGLGALVRQYLVDGFYPGGAPDPSAGFEPSAALVKAMLIASAVDLTELGCTAAGPVPSPAQGWGLVQLDRVLLLGEASRRLVVVDEPAAFTGSGDQPVRAQLEPIWPGPLEVVLVWSDPPSSSVAAVNLVNDLDLVVSGPDGVLFGNRLVDGVSTPGGEADRLNNVEVVKLARATPGEWTIEVRPHAIREAPQGFALVVLGPPSALQTRTARGRLAP